MLHGWGMNSAVWSDFAESISVHYRLHLIDLPGHGDSRYCGESGVKEWSEACLAAAPQHALWLGWSLGAEIAMRAALDYPQRVSGLICLTGTPRFTRGNDWIDGMEVRVLEQFISAARKDIGKTLERFLALQVRGSEGERELLRSLKLQLRQKPSAKAEALAAGLQLLRDVDLRAELSSIGCPTGWIFGERDTLVSAKLAGQLTNLLPRMECEVVAGASHAPFLSHLPITLRLVKDMLETMHENR
jgi:pimeloyl-[acyl-carrier protein] methyl ester esterase